MKLSQRARAEQDYYLRHDGQDPTEVSEAARLAFLQHDSQGAPIEPSNPVLVAKAHYGMSIKEMQRTYLQQGWPGGLCIVNDTLATTGDLRPIIEAYGPDAVIRWLDAWAEEWEKR